MAKKENGSFVKIEEFEGKKTFTIYKNSEDKFPFRFQIKKAQLIVSHIDEIKKFVKDNS